ncbi:AAA family ATPase [Actinomadura napierensis]|uniref:AAA+ ATPase domain-containing protein n=1 Tax=Actinomadura napierensis TaxID=267854 RepID=A0ABP5LK39_9ACTN
MNLEAQWALWSKPDGSYDEYRILDRAEGVFDRGEFLHILRQWSVGEPPAQRAGPGQLPWTTFSHVWKDGAPYIGIAVEKWTGRTDGAGRPVASTSYFAVPYDPAAIPFSYSALHRAVQDIDLPLDPDEPFTGRERLELDVPPHDPHELARLVIRHGFDRVTAAAASTLAGTVDITNTGRDHDHATRLEFLDAVTALLPRGLATDFSASTWATGPQHRVRMAFTRHARPGARELNWADPQPAPAHATREYLRLLAAATDGGTNVDRLAAVIDRLAADRAPRDFGNGARQALSSLQTAIRTAGRVQPARPAPAPSRAAPAAAVSQEGQDPMTVEPASDTAGASGYWSSRIHIEETPGAVRVTGTRFKGDPPEIRTALKTRGRAFSWDKAQQAWIYDRDPARVPEAADALRQVLADLDQQAAAQGLTTEPSKPRFPPTEQQAAIIEAVRQGQDVAVLALAGTGKTTTMRLIAEALPDKRITYLAFNRSIMEEAEAAMPRNVTAVTSHAIARRALNAGPMADKIRRARKTQRGRGSNTQRFARWPEEIAPIIGPRVGITGPSFINGQEYQPEDIAQMALATVKHYRISAEDQVSTENLPIAVQQNKELAPLVLRYAQVIWEDIASPDGELYFEDDDYRKIWIESRPVIDADIIIFDEAQDINPVLSKLVQRQPTQTIVVGDSYQSIYGFTGAVDALATWPADVVLPLTQSWRFGPQIAQLGNDVLRTLGADLELRGNPALDTRVGQVDNPDAVLTRTNAGAVAEVIDAMNDGKRVALVGGGKAIEDIAQAAIDLRSGRGTSHPELSRFRTWNEVIDAAENDPDGGRALQMFVRLVERYTPEGLIDTVADLVDEDSLDPTDPDALVVSTAHKAKGREWGSVRISGDFHGPTTDEETGDLVLPPAEERRLAYVTVTRPKVEIELGSLDWITNPAAAAQAAVARPAPAQEAAAQAQPAGQVLVAERPADERPEPTRPEPTPAPTPVLAMDERDAATVEGDPGPDFPPEPELPLDPLFDMPVPAAGTQGGIEAPRETMQPPIEAGPQPVPSPAASETAEPVSEPLVTQGVPDVRSEAVDAALVGAAPEPQPQASHVERSGEERPLDGDLASTVATPDGSTIEPPRDTVRSTEPEPVAAAGEPEQLAGGRRPHPITFTDPADLAPDAIVEGISQLGAWGVAAHAQQVLLLIDDRNGGQPVADIDRAATRFRALQTAIDQVYSELGSPEARRWMDEVHRELLWRASAPEVGFPYFDRETLADLAAPSRASAEPPQPRQPVAALDYHAEEEPSDADLQRGYEDLLASMAERVDRDLSSDDPTPGGPYTSPETTRVARAFEQLKRALADERPDNPVIAAINSAAARERVPAAHAAGTPLPLPTGLEPLHQPLRDADAHSSWYYDTPQWQQVKAVTTAFRNLADAIAAAPRGYLSEVANDVRTHGFLRMVGARVSRVISRAARAIAAGLEKAGLIDTPAWLSVQTLHTRSADFSDQLMGNLPPGWTVETLDNLNQTWKGLRARSGQALAARDAAEGLPAAGSTAAARSARARARAGISELRTALTAGPRAGGEVTGTRAWQRLSEVWDNALPALARAHQGILRFEDEAAEIGALRAAWMRTCELASATARHGMDRLEASSGDSHGAGWHALRLVRHVAELNIAHQRGDLPPEQTAPLGTYDLQTASRGPANAEPQQQNHPPRQEEGAERDTLRALSDPAENTSTPQQPIAHPTEREQARPPEPGPVPEPTVPRPAPDAAPAASPASFDPASRPFDPAWAQAEFLVGRPPRNEQAAQLYPQWERELARTTDPAVLQPITAKLEAYDAYTGPMTWSQWVADQREGNAAGTTPPPPARTPATRTSALPTGNAAAIAAAAFPRSVGKQLNTTRKSPQASLSTPPAAAPKPALGDRSPGGRGD